MRQVTKTQRIIFGMALCTCLFNLGFYFSHSPSHAKAFSIQNFMAAGQNDLSEAPAEGATTLNGHAEKFIATHLPGEKVIVPLKQDERSLMVEAQVDNSQTAHFIVDTGATYTTISSDMARNLGYDLDEAPHITITTANGQISIPKIKLHALTLNGYTVYDVEATVMKIPKNVPFDGLLGLSFIKHQKMTLDLGNNSLIIEAPSTYSASR